MPHLVILYTPGLDSLVKMDRLCRDLADTMLSVCDEQDKQVFPTGGTRVLAFPATYAAVADSGVAGEAAGGNGQYGFVYLNLRMGIGRSRHLQQMAGDALLATAKRHFEPVLAAHHVGVTLQIDESPGQVYDAKLSSLHPLFR
jgi:5-carboxymethyl-2-hydroxymuconate isomerase